MILSISFLHQKLNQFGIYLNTTLLQMFIQTSTALFNSMLYVLLNELNSTVFTINKKFNKNDTKLIKVETTTMK